MPHTREKAENHTRTCPRQEILLMPHPQEEQGSEFVPYWTPENTSRRCESEGKRASSAPALLGLPAVGWAVTRGAVLPWGRAPARAVPGHGVGHVAPTAKPNLGGSAAWRRGAGAAGSGPCSGCSAGGWKGSSWFLVHPLLEGGQAAPPGAQGTESREEPWCCCCRGQKQGIGVKAQIKT